MSSALFSLPLSPFLPGDYVGWATVFPEITEDDIPLLCFVAVDLLFTSLVRNSSVFFSMVTRRQTSTTERMRYGHPFPMLGLAILVDKVLPGAVLSVNASNSPPLSSAEER